jgi:hypothetical protein
LFNKPYILDIAPKASVIEGLTDRGYDVYLLDWGTPGYEDKNIGLDTYIQKYEQQLACYSPFWRGSASSVIISGGTINYIRFDC